MIKPWRQWASAGNGTYHTAERGFAHLVEAQVVRDRGWCIKYHPFRAHHQSKAIQGLEEMNTELASGHIHAITQNEKAQASFCLSFQTFSPLLCSLHS